MSRLRLAPADAGPPSPWDEPIHILLEQLRTWKAGAYSCLPGPASWLADCIVCGGLRTVRIDEPTPGGRVFVQCRTGCTAEEIGTALDRAVDHADPWAQVAARDDLLDELQALAHAQADLIDRLTRTNVDTEAEAA